MAARTKQQLHLHTGHNNKAINQTYTVEPC